MAHAAGDATTARAAGDAAIAAQRGTPIIADVKTPIWQDVHWLAADGTRLHARDYPPRAAGDGSERPPIVCLPGLTRNARDFADLAARIASGRRVIAAELRGRGGSEQAKDPASYQPATYVADTLAMLDALGIVRAAFVGTSLGGLVTMMLAAQAPERVAGAVLNDVGPVIEPAGLARIRAHVGRASVWPTWMHAARAVAELNRDAHPDWGLRDWLATARRLYRVSSSGRIVLDYDLRIGDAFKLPPTEPPPDLWPLLDGLAGKPVLVVRGERSDVLGVGTAARMATALPGAEVVPVPRTGHAPTLAEPVAAAAIDRWLERLR